MTLVDIAQFDQERLALLIYKIKESKAQYDSDLTDSDQYLKGLRYSDNQRIARMILGDIYSQSGFNIEVAKAKFLSLDSTEIQPYIKSAVLESASADHWYTYEKQW